MAKIPDLSELTKKFDIHGLIDSVKSAVSGGGAPPKAPDGDEIAARFVEIINLAQSVAAAHAEQAKAVSTIHAKLNALYKDVQAQKEAELAAKSAQVQVVATATTTTEEVTVQDSACAQKDTSEEDKK